MLTSLKLGKKEFALLPRIEEPTQAYTYLLAQHGVYLDKVKPLHLNMRGTPSAPAVLTLYHDVPREEFLSALKEIGAKPLYAHTISAGLVDKFFESTCKRILKDYTGQTIAIRGKTRSERNYFYSNVIFYNLEASNPIKLDFTDYEKSLCIKSYTLWDGKTFIAITT